MKRHFLVAYDYGQGAVWAFIVAPSPRDIRRELPQLEVVSNPPSWMTEEELERIKRRMTFDVDEARGNLLALLERPYQKGRTGKGGSRTMPAKSGSRKIYRSARTGRFVKKSSVKRNSATTVTETVKGSKKGKRAS